MNGSPSSKRAEGEAVTQRPKRCHCDRVRIAEASRAPCIGQTALHVVKIDWTAAARPRICSFMSRTKPLAPLSGGDGAARGG